MANRVCRDGISTGRLANTDKALGFFREAIKAGAEK